MSLQAVDVQLSKYGTETCTILSPYLSRTFTQKRDRNELMKDALQQPHFHLFYSFTACHIVQCIPMCFATITFLIWLMQIILLTVNE